MRGSVRHFLWFLCIPEVLDFLFRCVQPFMNRGIRDGSVPARLRTEGGENGRPARKRKNKYLSFQTYDYSSGSREGGALADLRHLSRL